VAGFSAGQAVLIDSGASQETAIVASVAGGRGGATLTLTSPLTSTHASGAEISGTGITLTAPMTRAHASGAPVNGGLPTPGAPNRYERGRGRR
jgi:hypothetical protein